MAEYKPRIVLSKEVGDMIEWFTYNINTEIGAVGTVKVKMDEKDKYFYVEKLFFPKQHVTSATVEFDGSMWGDLIRKHGMEEMGKIAFYWHRHPGSAHHSGTDEVDTYETFMSKEMKPMRPYFIFMQTAEKSNGEMDIEARIDVRNPIRATITKDISVEWEDEDRTELIEKCEAIKKECIVPKTYTQPARAQTYTPSTGIASANNSRAWNNSNSFNRNSVDRDWTNNTARDIEQLNKAAINKLFNNVTDTKQSFYMDNDFLDGHATSNEEKVGIEFINGMVRIVAGAEFQKVMVAVLDAKSAFSKIIRQEKATEVPGPADKPSGKIVYSLQPKAKQYKELCQAMTQVFYNFNKNLLDKIKKEESDLPEAKEGVVKTTGNRSVKYREINGKVFVANVLGDLLNYAKIDWDDKNVNNGTVYDMENTYLGWVEVAPQEQVAKFAGDKLVPIVDEIIMSIHEDVFDKQEELEEEAEDREEEFVIVDKYEALSGDDFKKTVQDDWASMQIAFYENEDVEEVFAELSYFATINFGDTPTYGDVFGKDGKNDWLGAVIIGEDRKIIALIGEELIENIKVSMEEIEQDTAEQQAVRRLAMEAEQEAIAEIKVSAMADSNPTKKMSKKGKGHKR